MKTQINYKTFQKGGILIKTKYKNVGNSDR